MTANGGQAGIDAFVAAHAEGGPFPVVITDLGMPYVDGRKVAAPSRPRAVDPGDHAHRLGSAAGRRGRHPGGRGRVLSKPPKLIDLREALAARQRPVI